MRNTITRKIVETKVHGYAISIPEIGEPTVEHLAPITVYGKISEKDAEKEIRKAYPNSVGVTVSKIESEEVQYEISVEDFVKNAKKIENAESVEKENE